MLNINFQTFPTITTERLELRQMVWEDAKDLFAIRTDPQVNKYLDRISPTSIYDVENFIEKINTGIAENKWFYWVISLREKKQLIGTICLWNISLINNSAEIGYELHPDYHGKGMMQEALSAIINYGFEQIEFKSLEAFTHKNNLSSTKLLEKFNFKRDIKLEEKISKADLGENVVYILKNKSI